MKDVLQQGRFQLFFCHTARAPSSAKDLTRFRPWTLAALAVLQSFLRRGLLPQLSPTSNYQLGLTLCGNHRMKSLNRRYRGMDRSTDVLSFPVHQNLRKLKAREKKTLHGEVSLGDIYICREIAAIQSKKFGVSLEMEYIYLFVHGLLHLYGYDHEVSAWNEKVMKAMEEKFVKAIIQKMKNK